MQDLARGEERDQDAVSTRTRIEGRVRPSKVLKLHKKHIISDGREDIMQCWMKDLQYLEGGQ